MSNAEAATETVETSFISDRWAMITIRNQEGEVIRTVGIPVHKLIADEIVQQVAENSEE